MNYTFVKTFSKNFKKNIGQVPTEEQLFYIKEQVACTPFHSKTDEKGRHSQYHTFSFNGKLITVVVDGDNYRIVTAVIETHRRWK